MARDETDDVLPDKDVAKEFYAKYEPKEILGRGVSSTVRRCVEKETGREYACKIMDISGDPSENDGPKLKESTLREISVLRRVAGHPYIIELHDVFESETFIFLVFELCRNGELFDYLTSVVTLSEKKTKYIMKQLFEALQHVHRMNIAHRDIKPENILLDDNLNVKLTDFGFAVALKKEQKLFELVGTPGYLAPELLKTNMFEETGGYGKEVDVWACGVIMYTLLVGCPPFWHRKQMVMLRNIMEGRYCFTSPEWDDITDTPKDLISKLLIVDPKKRYTVDDALNHEFFQILVSGFSNSRVWLLTNVAILTKLTLTTFDSCSVSVSFLLKTVNQFSYSSTIPFISKPCISLANFSQIFINFAFNKIELDFLAQWCTACSIKIRQLVINRR